MYLVESGRLKKKVCGLNIDSNLEFKHAITRDVIFRNGNDRKLILLGTQRRVRDFRWKWKFKCVYVWPLKRNI